MAARSHNCLTHMDVPAVSHCAQCHRPMCADCIAGGEGDADFCSVDCQADYRKFFRQYRPTRPRGFGLVGWILWLGALAGLGLGALYAGRHFGVSICDTILKSIGL